MLLSRGKACVESWQLAPVSLIARGMPCPSQTKCRLLPSLARSVGFGPLNSPQKPRARSNCRQQHATSRSGHHGQASSAMRNGSSPRFRLSASRATAASRSSRNHTPDVSAACGLGRWRWEKRFDQNPQRIRNEYGGHMIVRSLNAFGMLDMLGYQQGRFCYSLLNLISGSPLLFGVPAP